MEPKDTYVPKEIETPSDSQPDLVADEGADKKTENGATPSPENKQPVAPEAKPLPFHEDPKVQEYLDRQMAAREKALRESLEKDFEAKYGQKPAQKDTEEDIPEWFGGGEKSAENLRAWQAYKKAKDDDFQKAVDAAVEKIQNTNNEKQKAVDDANKWFEDSISTIEAKAGKKIDREALLKFTVDKQLIDPQGRWNYQAAYDWMSSMTPATPVKDPKDGLDERKKIADATTGQDGGKPETGAKTFKTNEDFKKEKPW